MVRGVLNGLDLFSGIGGISLALSELVKPICYVEIDKYCQGVIKSRIADGGLPEAPIWDDVRTFDGLPFRGLVDIIYGGFPCQDISCAGNGEGLAGKRSGLFFEIMRLAEEIKPQYIFLENVPAITSRGLSVVVKEIASLRYDCRYGVLSAYDVGAPHQRDRWFFMANYREQRCGEQKNRELGFEGRAKIIRASDIISNTNDAIRDESGRISRKDRTGETKFGDNGEKEPVADTNMPGREEQRQSEPNFKELFDSAECSSWWQAEPDVGRVVDELPFRVDRIKCLGNAVVPAQVSEAFKRLTGLDL